MSFNLLDTVKGLVTPELISSASSLLGENSTGVTKALDVAVPALLSGIVNKAGSDSSGLLDMATKAAGSGVLDNVLGLFGGSGSSLLGLGSTMLSGIFGDRADLLTNLISGFSGTKPSSASSLLSALAPLALGTIGKHALTNGLDAKGLAGLLGGQKETIRKALPEGLNLASVLNVPAVKPQVREAVAQVAEPEKKGMPGWLLPLLLVLLGGLLIWYFMGGKKEPAKETVPATDTTTVAPAPAVEDEVVVERQLLKVMLPDGTALDAYKGGIEDRLVNFLKDPNSVAGKDVWFDFDNLNFELGTATITAASQAQINNIAAILKAFPKAKVKIGGYTDKTGDETANMKLSDARAKAVQSALNAAGVGAQVTGAEGYGSQFAKIPANAPEDERQKDRRVSVSVREK